MEKICGVCKHWKGDHDGVGVCVQGLSSEDGWVFRNLYTSRDMSCPRFSSRDAVPQFLKDWKPVWHDLMEPEPATQQLVLMWYLKEPKPKVGFVIGGVWYKAAGSTTVSPDFWTELP